jgi:hypothetical protein
LCNENGQYVVYESDRYGFNNADGIYSQRGQRIVIAGDSFGHGFCVPPGEDLAARLRGMKYNAISISAGGNGPLIELAALRGYVLSFRPRLVLWLYYDGNDLSVSRKSTPFRCCGGTCTTLSSLKDWCTARTKSTSS